MCGEYTNLGTKARFVHWVRPASMDSTPVPRRPRYRCHIDTASDTRSGEWRVEEESAAIAVKRSVTRLTARGASSPANPALHIPDPLSSTSPATSSDGRAEETSQYEVSAWRGGAQWFGGVGGRLKDDAVWYLRGGGDRTPCQVLGRYSPSMAIDCTLVR